MIKISVVLFLLMLLVFTIHSMEQPPRQINVQLRDQAYQRYKQKRDEIIRAANLGLLLQPEATDEQKDEILRTHMNTLRRISKEKREIGNSSAQEAFYRCLNGSFFMVSLGINFSNLNELLCNIGCPFIVCGCYEIIKADYAYHYCNVATEQANTIEQIIRESHQHQD